MVLFDFVWVIIVILREERRELTREPREGLASTRKAERREARVLLFLEKKRINFNLSLMRAATGGYFDKFINKLCFVI